MMWNRVFIAVFFFVLFSCKKDQKERGYQSDLPNFGNINIDKVFSKSDNYLHNKDSIKQKLIGYYRKNWEKGDLWGGFLVAKGDNILFERYQGFTDESQQKPINENTPIHIASVSKPFTAMAVLKLVEAGKLQLNQRIIDIFPKFPYPKITIKNLLSHRSGLPKYEYFVEEIHPRPIELNKDFLTNQDVLDLLEKYYPDLASPPDTRFMYCNTNYAILALVVEKITNKPFPEAMQEMIFRPLKMKNTFIFEKKYLHTASKSFYQTEKEYPLNNLDLIYGDKNVYTTPRDLLKFSKAMFSVKFLGKAIKNQVFMPYSNEKGGVNNYGLGFRMKIFENGKKLTYHNGWWHGNNAVFVHLENSKITIIALGNKFSNRVYSATALSSLFEDFPYKIEEEK